MNRGLVLGLIFFFVGLLFLVGVISYNVFGKNLNSLQTLVLDGSSKDWKDYSKIEIKNSSNKEAEVLFNYDENNFYIFVKVLDDVPGKHLNIEDKVWLGDAVEVWFDFNLSNNKDCKVELGNFSRDCILEDNYQFVFGANNKSREYIFGLTSSNYSVNYIPSLESYSYEFSIPLEKLRGFNPRVSSEIGVAVVLDDLDRDLSFEEGQNFSNENLDGRVFWPEGYIWGNPNTFEKVEI